MRAVRDIIDTLGHSEPIFNLVVNEDGSEIRAEAVSRYDYTAPSGDAIAQLVEKHYSETFSVSNRCWKIKKDDIYKDVVNDINNCVLLFVKRNIGGKSPHQTGLYKYFKYDNYFNKYSRQEELLSLYKFIRTFSDTEMRSFDKKKADTVIALLEAIRNKYER